MRCTLHQCVLWLGNSCLCRYGFLPDLNIPERDMSGSIDLFHVMGYEHTAFWIFEPGLHMWWQRSRVKVSGRPRAIIEACPRAAMATPVCTGMAKA